MSSAYFENPAPYVWQESTWDKLVGARAHLPHALLLTGANGTGKTHFALKLAELLLCSNKTNPKDDPVDVRSIRCGHCHSCNLFRAKTNPDLELIQPQEGGRIVLEDIHLLRKFLQLTSHLGGFKVAVIAHAEKMNRSASNALLKILEEPPEGKFLILVTENALRITATVRSRCVDVPLCRPTDAELTDWLDAQSTEIPPGDFLRQYGDNRPLYIHDLLTSGKGNTLREILDALSSLGRNDEDRRKLVKECSDVMRLKTGALYPIDILDLLLYTLGNKAFEGISQQNHLNLSGAQSYYRLYRTLMNRRRILNGGIALNPELLFEECIGLWQRAFPQKLA